MSFCIKNGLSLGTALWSEFKKKQNKSLICFGSCWILWDYHSHSHPLKKSRKKGNGAQSGLYINLALTCLKHSDTVVVSTANRRLAFLPSCYVSMFIFMIMISQLNITVTHFDSHEHDCQHYFAKFMKSFSLTGYYLGNLNGGWWK